MIRNMVKQSCAAPGTGTTITLASAQAGYSSFDGYGNAQPAYYMLTDGAQSELQAGTVTVGSPSTLSRGTPIWNSAGTGVRLNFTGTCTVYGVIPAERSLYADASSVWQAQSRRMAGLADGTALQDSATLNQTGWRWLSSAVFAVAQTTVVFSLPAALTRFRLEWSEFAPSASAAMFARLSFDGGSTYAAGASDYLNAYNEVRAGANIPTSLATTYAVLGTNTPTASMGCMEFTSGGQRMFTVANEYLSATGSALTSFTGGGLCSASVGTATHIQVGCTGVNVSVARIRLLGGT